MINIIAVSDLHSRLPDISPCDLLLIAGDICPDGLAVTQAKWLDTSFRAWLERIPAKEIVGVAGNHDKIFETSPHLIPQGLRWHYLQDNSVKLFDLNIHGTPWQLPLPEFPSLLPAPREKSTPPPSSLSSLHAAHDVPLRPRMRPFFRKPS